MDLSMAWQQCELNEMSAYFAVCFYTLSFRADRTAQENRLGRYIFFKMKIIFVVLFFILTASAV
jgi:hypothetical protein